MIKIYNSPPHVSLILMNWHWSDGPQKCHWTRSVQFYYKIGVYAINPTLKMVHKRQIGCSAVALGKTWLYMGWSRPSPAHFGLEIDDLLDFEPITKHETDIA